MIFKALNLIGEHTSCDLQNLVETNSIGDFGFCRLADSKDFPIPYCRAIR